MKEADKYDAQKVEYALLPVYALEQMARVLTFGAMKYDPHNWRRGMQYSRLISAMERHLAAYKVGEDLDPETKLEHLAHIMCSCSFLMEYRLTYPQGDDRPKGAVDRNGNVTGGEE